LHLTPAFACLGQHLTTVDDSSDLSIDLSTAATWRGVRPGMLRSEVMRILQASGAEIDDPDSDWQLAMWDESNLELFFAGEGETPLRQVLLDDEVNSWGGQPIIDKPLHEALALLGDAARDASWRPECAAEEGFADLNPPKAGPFSDESLLYEGTLWLPRKNFGLVMCEGVVNSIVWRRPEDFPRQLVGPVTEAQKQLSARPDREEHLWKRVREESSPQESSPRSRSQSWLRLAFILVLVWLGAQAFQEQQRWQTAPRISGKVTEIVDPPKGLTKKLYRVSFADAEGRSHSADLEPGEFYVTPTAPGEEVELAFVAGNPPRVMGPSRIRDAAFLRYVPWFIGATALYAILSLSLRFLVRQMKAQQGVVVSPVLPTPPGGKQ